MREPFGHKHRRVGEVYWYLGQVWRRGVGIIYVAHSSPPFMTKLWLKRRAKRDKKRGLDQ